MGRLVHTGLGSSSRRVEMETPWRSPLTEVDNINFQWQNRWKYQTVSVQCVPLTRRAMEWDAIARIINITGADHYKVEANAVEKLDGILFTEKQVAEFYAMH